MSVKIKRHFRPAVIRILLVGILCVLWVWLFRIYHNRVSAFGCFDDCFNIVGGYFLLTGKRLYTQLFFDHQPFMAYGSAAIQQLGSFTSLYSLIRVHRDIIIAISIISTMLLTLRFGLVGFGFSLLYELTKGYLFGERFLGESIIVYPVVYLSGLVWESIQKKPIRAVEAYLAALFTWMVMFTREPYVPLAIFLFCALWFFSKKRKAVLNGGLLLGCISVATIMAIGPRDYYFNLVTANISIMAKEGAGLVPWMKPVFILLYPIVLLLPIGLSNVFRTVETSIALLLVASMVLLVKHQGKKTFPLIAYVFVALALANIRPPWVVGEIWYGNFHHLIWYALAIFFAMEAVALLRQRTLWWWKIGTVLCVSLILYAAATPSSYLHDVVDRTEEFTVNYAQPFVTGEIIRLLSAPGDTLFVDREDDLIYWQTKLPTPYRYGWYTSMMPLFAPYRDARQQMFQTTPPTFLFRLCTKGIVDPAPVPNIDVYVRITIRGEPSCLFIHTSKLPAITDEQWKNVEKYSVTKP